MKTYTTIFLDVDNITFDLHNHRHMHRYSREMVEQILKNGIRSLQEFEVIGLLGKDERYGRNYILKNHFDHIKYVSREYFDVSKSSAYLEKLLKYYNRNRKEVLVVSGNPNLLKVAGLLEMDTCYFNVFEPQLSNIKSTITVNKLNELLQYRPIEKKRVDNININLDYHYFVDSNTLEILNKKGIVLDKKFNCEEKKFMNFDLKDGNPFIVTMDLALAMKLKKEGFITYFVNNHYNDDTDYIADYESSIEEVSKNLVKIMNTKTK